jgi:transposase
LRSDMEWAEMLALHRDGMSIGDIANIMGLNRKTVSKYIRAASPPRYRRPDRGSKLDPFKDHIRARLAEYPFTATRMYREIREMGYDGGITILKEFMAPLRDASRVVAEIRFETDPGEQAQVDWIDLGRVRICEEVLHLHAFVMVLSYSRMRFVHVTTDCRTETFIQCHLLAFQYFGGWPRTILYDNLKSVVLKRALLSSESTFNPMFLDFAQHHGVTPRLCRPGIEGAKTKGKVERAIQYVEKDFFLGVEFDSVSHLNSKLELWCQEANSKMHGTTHEVPLQRWSREGLTAFGCVPPYPLTIILNRRASKDCFVRYENNFYSVPWRHAGRECRLVVREGTLHIEVAGEPVAEHRLLQGSFLTSRRKEHFEGLHKLKRDANKIRHERRLASLTSANELVIAPPVDVERRDLSTYDMFMGGAS